MSGTLREKVNRMEKTKYELKQAIIDKGGSVSNNTTFRQYADAIKGITGGSSTIIDQPVQGKSILSSIKKYTFPDTSKFTRLSEFFRYLDNYTSFDLTGFKTDSCMDFNGMFFMCENILNLDLRNLKFDKAERFSDMFWRCYKLKTVEFPYPMSCPNLKDMGGMFKECNSLQSVNLGGLRNTTKLESMYDMFNGCSSLHTINLIELNTSSLKDISGMFNGCTNLTTVNWPSIFTLKRNSSGSYPIINLGYCSKLSRTSIINLISNITLGDGTGGIRLHATAKNRLTNADIAKAKDKGWPIL